MNKQKLLWIGDAAVPSGFARVTHGILDQLCQSWDVHVLGVNYQGDPHKFPYPIYPAQRVWDLQNGGDQLGVSRLVGLVREIRPNVIVVLNDAWNVAGLLEYARKNEIKLPPVVAYIPVDSENMRDDVAKDLHGLATAVFYTEFGLDQARRSGYHGPAEVIPHGVDLERYQPIDRTVARSQTGLDAILRPDCFLIGNVNRNQPRKRLDLTMGAFAKWIHTYDVPENVQLYFHCNWRDEGWDLGQLARHFGLQGRVILPRWNPGDEPAEEHMAAVYSSLDLQISTTDGEGWGLTTMEGMSCGVPQVVPDFAALGEWAAPAAALIHCDHWSSKIGRINTIGRTPSETHLIHTVDHLYRSRHERETMTRKGLALVGRPEFRWESIARRFEEVLHAIGKHQAPREFIERSGRPQPATGRDAEGTPARIEPAAPRSTAGIEDRNPACAV